MIWRCRCCRRRVRVCPLGANNVLDSFVALVPPWEQWTSAMIASFSQLEALPCLGLSVVWFGCLGWGTWSQMLLSSSEDEWKWVREFRACDEVSWLMWWWSWHLFVFELSGTFCWLLWMFVDFSLSSEGSPTFSVLLSPGGPFWYWLWPYLACECTWICLYDLSRRMREGLATKAGWGPPYLTPTISKRSQCVLLNWRL
jgi:hypothetical protein